VSVSSKPHLLFIAQCYHNRGGVEEHIRSLTAGLEEHYTISVLAPENGRLLLIQSQQVTASLPADPPVWPLTPYHLAQTEQSLCALIERIRPDIIHVQHFLNWHIGLFDQLLEYRLPVVVSFHDFYTVTPYFTMQGAANPAVALGEEYNRLVFGTDIRPYLEKRLAAIRSSLERCRAWVAPSAFLAEQLSLVLPLPYQIIEHGITPFHAQPLQSDAAGRFGCIGSKLPQKGWMELLKAFQILRHTHPQAELYFFGGGQEAPPQSSPGVQFFGAYAPEELPEILSRFEIGVVPSLFPETFSYVLSEHWAGGKAVAASHIGALGRRVSDGENGRLFLPGNIESMVEVLGWFLESSDWRSWSAPPVKTSEAMAREYHLLYQQLLNKAE
jgi:glycosyltransferase involved in cell wall biosynthesis